MKPDELFRHLQEYLAAHAHLQHKDVRIQGIGLVTDCTIEAWNADHDNTPCVTLHVDDAELDDD